MLLYCFDFDDTIVVSSSRIWTEQGPLTTEEYAATRAPLCPVDPFREFRDVEACTLEPGPFHHVFIRALVSKAPVAIITARDHDSSDMRTLITRAARLGGAELHADVHMYCCSSPDWALDGSTRPARKCAAILDFVSKYPEARSVGFSDDDPENCSAVTALFQVMQKRYERTKWKVFPCGLAQRRCKA